MEEQAQKPGINLDMVDSKEFKQELHYWEQVAKFAEAKAKVDMALLNSEMARFQLQSHRAQMSEAMAKMEPKPTSEVPSVPVVENPTPSSVES